MDKILIIQDSPCMNALLRSRLEEGGFSVDTVETGEEGVKKAKEIQYQLILLDYTLPGIDGPGVCRILKGEKNSQGMPIIFFSAKDEKEMRKVVKDTGADGFIGLFEGKELIQKLKAFIPKER